MFNSYIYETISYPKIFWYNTSSKIKYSDNLHNIRRVIAPNSNQEIKFQMD